MRLIVLIISIILALFLIGGCVPQPEEEKDIEKDMEKEVKMADVLLIIAEEDFQDMELKNTKEAIESSGLTTITASKTIGMKKGAFGETAEAGISLEDVNVNDYKAIIFIGGSGSQQYFNDNTALKIASDAANAGKVVAAICIAPIILANAEILQDKKATIWDDESGTYSKMLENKGAIYTGKDVEQDDNIITANGPPAATKFGNAVANAVRGLK